MKKRSKILAQKLEQLQGKEYSLSQEGILSVVSKNGSKKASGHLMHAKDGSLNFHLHETDYNRRYLKSFLTASLAAVGPLNFFDYPEVNDVIWIYPLASIPDPDLNEKLDLSADTRYYRINNGPVACAESIGMIGKRFEALFKSKQRDVCDGGTIMTNFFEVLLNKVL